ncbi:MAG: hypothetical protein E7099_10255 [Mediterranea massiliensis]|nr:hypothetical protein [Mediterranea massiliensis]
MIYDNQNIGKQHKGDSEFVAKCRLLQSIYRTEIGEDEGYIQRGEKRYYYGNYIMNGEKSGKNFLEDYIFNYAKDRVKNCKYYETINEERLFNNLLSSQPMAFNLFCPLIKMLEEDESSTTDILRTALPDYNINKVTKIDLEFIPDNYKKLTNDLTAMDAIIEFTDNEGIPSFIAIETKYSENLGTNEASDKGKGKGKAKAIETIKSLRIFQSEIENRITSKEVALTQIYRNFLLSETYGIDQNKKAYSIVLAPKEHPTTTDEVNSLKNELKEEYRYKISSVNLEDFVLKLIEKSQGKYQATFRAFYDRYLNFEKTK